MMVKLFLRKFCGAGRLLCLAVLLFPVLAVAQQSLMVAGGAGYKRPIEEIAQGFEAGSKIRVERFYGHMGQVLAQARASGKVAVVFGEREVLEGAEQVKFSRFLPLGTGRLVVAWPKGKQMQQPKDVASAAFARIALADTRQAIFGKAALEYLQHAGLYPLVEKRLLTVSMVPQVSSYLVSGEVDAGFINLTEALAIRDQIGGYLEIPQAEYTPVAIVAAQVSGQDSAEVQAFVSYLQTPAVSDILKRYGM
jgi:molybdate transport system substrate-binding protein